MTRHSKTTYITLTGTILADTGKAIRVQVTHVSGEKLSQSQTEWIPVSQCSKMFKDPTESGKDWVMVAEWICKEKKLLEAPKQGQEEPEDMDSFDKFMDESAGNSAPF